MGQDYNTIDAFRLIDVDGQGSVSPEQIQRFIDQNLQITYDQHKLQLFILRFDKNEKNRLKYSEFCTAFAPQSARTQQELVNRTPSNTQLEKSYQDTFAHQTKQLYEQCWALHFRIESTVEMMRQKLLKNPFFDISKAYRDIDSSKKGYIIAGDLGKFLDLHDVTITKQQEQLIFERFNKR